MRKISVTLLFNTCFTWVSLSANAQNCTVEMESLKGTYEGDCKKGKANGEGLAKGEDSYKGEFKNGYPDGHGVYTWKNGDWYDGSWKKGVMEGKGEMHHPGKTADDTLQTGFWKKGKYIGKYETPYTIHSKTSRIGSVDATVDTTLSNFDVTFNAEQVYYGKPTLTNMQVINGRFVSQFSVDTRPRVTVNTLRTVTFPFRVRLYYNTENILDIEFFEAGNWTINIRIS